MKIGFDAKRAFLNEAGLGNYSRNTLNALQKYFPENQYILFTPEIRTDLFKEYVLFDVISPDSPLKRMLKSIWRSFSLARQLEKNELDLFHGLSNELPAGIHQSKVPSVVTIHDLIFLRFPQFYKPVDRRIYLEKVKYACRAATQIIAISRQTRDDLVNFLKVDPSRIEVIYQGISERFFMHRDKEEVDEVLARYNLPPNFILTVGTVEPRKNQLGVLRTLLRHDLDIPYVIVGKPTIYSTKISEYCLTNKLENRVFQLSEVPDSDLPALYQQARCMVYVSHYEGFGLPIVEAMASGCPVITSSVSCLPEIGADAALYCQPDDEEKLARLLSDILSDDNLYNDLVDRGKKHAQQFHPEVRVENLMSLYQKIAQK